MLWWLIAEVWLVFRPEGVGWLGRAGEDVLGLEMCTMCPEGAQVQTTGTDHGYRPQVQTTGTDHRYRPQVQTTGTDHGYRPRVQTTGTDHRYRPQVQTTGTDLCVCQRVDTTSQGIWRIWGIEVWMDFSDSHLISIFCVSDLRGWSQDSFIHWDVWGVWDVFRDFDSWNLVRIQIMIQMYVISNQAAQEVASCCK